VAGGSGEVAKAQPPQEGISGFAKQR